MSAQTLDYRIAIGRFESAFEASELLPDDDRESLLRDVAKQILGQLPAIETSRSTAEQNEVGVDANDQGGGSGVQSLPHPLLRTAPPGVSSPGGFSGKQEERASTPPADVKGPLLSWSRAWTLSIRGPRRRRNKRKRAATR